MVFLTKVLIFGFPNFEKAFQLVLLLFPQVLQFQCYIEDIQDFGGTIYYKLNDRLHLHDLSEA